MEQIYCLLPVSARAHTCFSPVGLGLPATHVILHLLNRFYRVQFVEAGNIDFVVEVLFLCLFAQDSIPKCFLVMVILWQKMPRY